MHTGKRDRFTPNASGVYNEGEGIVNRINLLNLTAGVKMKVCDLSLAVSNLLNYTYYTPASMMMARNAEYAHADGRKDNTHCSVQILILKHSIDLFSSAGRTLKYQVKVDKVHLL